MHCYADCAVKGSCEPKLVLAVQLPAKLKVYTLVVSPFVGCPVPLKVAFWVPARIDTLQRLHCAYWLGFTLLPHNLTP